MSDAVVRVALLLAIFASVFVVSQALLGIAWSSRARFAAINKRLRMIREGRDREDVIIQLRKNEPSAFEGVPPIIAHPLRGLQRLSR